MSQACGPLDQGTPDWAVGVHFAAACAAKFTRSLRQLPRDAPTPRAGHPSGAARGSPRERGGRGAPGARRALSPSSAQVPRTDGHEKGKGNYWTFAGGCESLLDLFENGNFRRRRRRRGPKGEEARGARGRDAGAPPGPPEPPVPRSEPPTPASPAVLRRDAHRDIKFSIDYILSAPDPFPRGRSPHVHPSLQARQVNLQLWTV